MKEYYNKSYSWEYYVIAKEIIDSELNILQYISEVKLDEQKKIDIIWTQDLDLAQWFDFKHLSDDKIKLAIDKLIKSYHLDGQVFGFKIKSSGEVLNKL